MRERLFSLIDTVAVSTIIGTVCVVGVGVVALNLALTKFGEGEPVETSTEVTGTQPTVESPVVDESLDDTLDAGGPFYVVGSDIVAPDGNLFVPVGVNAAVEVTDFPFVFDGGNGGVAGHVDDVKAWGWNTVRINLVCNGAEDVSQSEVVEGITSAVDELTDAGIVVIITCHDGGGTNMTVNDDIEEGLRAFWDIVVTRYRDNPYVWFNFLNEPWEIRDEDNALNDWLTLHQFYINRYRNKGVENIIIVDIPGFAQAIDLLADDPFADVLSAECNVVFGWHAWGDLGGEEATPEGYRVKAEAARAKNLAIIISEAGVPEPLEAGTAGFPQWNVSGYYAALELASDGQFGLLWWNGTGDTDEELFYPLTADATGFWTAADGSNLSEAGQTFWDYSQTDRPAVAFEGSTPNSGCSSALGQ